MLFRASLAAALCASAVLALSPAAAGQAPLPGQIVVDPDHPQWLMRHGAEHVFFCGAGDPESFFYRGTRLPDGTRDGDQDALIDKLIAQGGNTLYVETIRSHGGDGQSDHNPFIGSDENNGIDQDILDQWEGWIQRCEDNGILTYLFIYDDSASVWSTGNQVGPEEDAYVRAIVDAFEHHANIIWLVSEESEEAMTDSRTRKIAEVIEDADDHGHIVGNHHHSGTTFKAWQDGSALKHFSMHYSTLPIDAHAGALEGRNKGVAAGAGGDAYFTMYTEAKYNKTATDVQLRHFIWDCALAGVMTMLYGTDIASTTDQLLNWCRVLQQFMESTDFYTMDSQDARAQGGTRWVLADASGESAILYADGANGDLGLAGMQTGIHDLRWVDCITGTTVSEIGVAVPGGDQLFARPAGIGDECALWVRRRWRNLGPALAGITGLPQLAVDSSMLVGEPLDFELTNARPDAITLIIVGGNFLGVPLVGGTLVPSLDVLVAVNANGLGKISFSTPWGGGVPTGASVYWQCWIVDPAGPFGFSSSQGVVGTQP